MLTTKARAAKSKRLPISKKGEKQYLEVSIEIKPADKSNFTEFSMDSFDRFQEVKNVYRIENGKLVLKNNPFTETWSPER